MAKYNGAELFPIVNEKGDVIGSASRKECHSGTKKLHPVVHLHVFDSEGSLFLQKRSEIRIYSQANGIRPSVGISIMERLSEKRCRGKHLKNLAFVQTTRSYCINMSLKAMWNGNWCIHSDA